MFCTFCRHRKRDLRCHARPPLPDDQGAGVWPLVQDRDQCAEFTPGAGQKWLPADIDEFTAEAALERAGTK